MLPPLWKKKKPLHDCKQDVKKLGIDSPFTFARLLPSNQHNGQYIKQLNFFPVEFIDRASDSEIMQIMIRH